MAHDCPGTRHIPQPSAQHTPGSLAQPWGSGTNAILICGRQMDVSTPTKRCQLRRVHLSRKNSPQTCSTRYDACQKASHK